VTEIFTLEAWKMVERRCIFGAIGGQHTLHEHHARSALPAETDNWIAFPAL